MESCSTGGRVQGHTVCVSSPHIVLPLNEDKTEMKFCMKDRE